MYMDNENTRLDRIINGTDRKKLINGFNNLKNDYNRIEAIKYSRLYENKPLSFILDNSNYIFTEGYKGYNFYKNVMETATLPYDQYDVQLGKIHEYLCEYSDKMSSKQYNMYDELYTIIEDVRDLNKNAVELHSEMTKHTSDNAMKLYDSIYLARNGLITESEVELEIDNAMFSNKCEFMDIVNCLVRNPDLGTPLNTYLELCYTENAHDTEEIIDNCKIKNILERMMKDKVFNESVKSIRNTNLRFNLIGLSQLSDVDLLESVAYEHVNYFDPMFSTMDDAIERVYMDNYISEYNKEERLLEKLDRQEKLISVYETVKDFVLFDLNNMNSSDLYTGNDLTYKTYLESHNDLPSIESSLIVLNDKINKLKAEYFSETVGGRDGKGSKAIQDMIPEELKKPIKKKSKDNDDNTNDTDENPFKSGSSKKREKSSKIKVVTKSEDEEDNNDHDDDMDNSKTKEYEDNEKPKGSKIRDIESGIVKANSEINKVASSAKNVTKHGKTIVRGVTEIPREIIKGTQDLVDDLKLMDENRRKKYMLQPGNRKKWIGRVKAVSQYGTAIAINPLLVPLLAFYRKESKTTNKRLSNEMKVELDTLIKNCDDNIDYFKSIDERDKANEWRMTKSKLEYTLARLRTNSKVI